MGKPKLINYSPPKSSIWGHLMGHKSPAAFRESVKAFLQQAAKTYETRACITACYVDIRNTEGTAFIRSFIEHNDVPADLPERRGLTYICEEVFDKCLDWLIANQALFPPRPQRVKSIMDLPPAFHFSLIRVHTIHGWKSGELIHSADVGSELEERYGYIQSLGTALTLGNVNEYLWVKEIAKTTLGISMNDKHIRPRKAITG